MNKDHFIFLHLPKTGGTTLRAILESRYQENQLYSIYEGDPNFHSMQDFHELPEEAKSAINVYTGHINFGMHRSLAGKSCYYAMLRDPVNRVISYYHHVLTYHKIIKNNKISLIKFINRRDPQVDNLQTRKLSGLSAPFGKCTKDMLWTAIDNIDKWFLSIGVTDRFDESFVILAEFIGWEISIYKTLNVGINRPPQEYFSETEINLIQQHNQLDSILYSYAKRKLDSQIKKMGITFDNRMKRLEEKMSDDTTKTA
jgi:hypothetical protein